KCSGPGRVCFSPPPPACKERSDCAAIRVRGILRTLTSFDVCGGCRSPRPSPRKRGERGSILTRDFLEAGDQFVDRLLDRDLLADPAVHCLGPSGLVLQDGARALLG